ncbi:MAG: dihydrofolate reductase, partial [Bacteroidaceae bacterium]|nr:dihydrofolate reductase [Bacteroidaceae bacterium]
GVNREEVEAYYASIFDKDNETPISYGLNTKVVKDENGNVKELAWYKGGIYGKAIEKICEELALAAKVAENDVQKRALGLLIKYYETGDLKLWDDFNVEWVKDTLGTVDFINGFVEDYNDPLGRKGAWEGYVHIKDHAASVRTEVLSANAQWFEDNSPVDPRFKKKECKGVSAKVVNAICLAGDAYPSTAIGINLPNADWIRKMYGSKSVTIANITKAYDLAAEESPMNTLDEFAYDEAEKEMARKWGSFTSDIHTDLHECLGHGSGQLLPGVSTTAMGEYASTLEEARADLFGLYYTADPKMQELGIIPDKDAYKAEYASYIRNGLMVQFNRIELGKPNTEAHMQNRKLIAEWCYEKGKKDNVIEKKVRDGKTYFVINDYVKLRALFAELLAEIQRIKSEGDYEAGKKLVETYAVNIDQDLHKEVLERYGALNLKPYGGFINPDIVPVVEDGKVVDYQVVYNDNYLEQQLYYGKKYSTL